MDERREAARARIARALEEAEQRQWNAIMGLLSEEGLATVEEIAGRLRLTRGAVRARLSDLQHAGYVGSVRKGELVARYHLVKE